MAENSRILTIGVGTVFFEAVNAAEPAPCKKSCLFHLLALLLSAYFDPVTCLLKRLTGPKKWQGAVKVPYIPQPIVE